VPHAGLCRAKTGSWPLSWGFGLSGCSPVLADQASDGVVTARNWSAPPARAWSSTRKPASRCCGLSWNPVTVTWYQHAAAYAAMKWPTLAAHSRASVAEALATVTPALTRATRARPPAAQLRTALYQHAFNPARTATSDEATARVLT
jgi:hypothetical protein